jgi:hypothetical protein
MVLMENEIGRGRHTFQADCSMVLVKDLINVRKVKLKLAL